MHTHLTDTTATRYASLRQSLRDMGRVAVGFSGGVDSTLLLKVAVDTLGADAVLAVIGDSESYPSRELAEARRLAEAMGATYRIIETHEMADARYAANPSNRCYYCKSDLFTRISAIAREEGYTAVVDGNNADDTGDWRPGRQAAQELGVRSPLIEAGMTKAEVRELSRALGLDTWDKPAFACLSSRIPHGTPITPEALAQVEAAEDALRDLGFTQVRVRHHGDVGRIETSPDQLARFLDADIRRIVADSLHGVGYRFVTLDLDGYRMGSMNAETAG